MKSQIGRRQETYYFLAVSLLLLLYIMPLLTVKDETLHVPPFDFLDISFPIAKLLSESGMLFAPDHAIIPNMMHGLPRLVFGSEFYYLPWLFKLFPPYSVYIVNELLMHISAFIGMLLLLRKVLEKEDSHIRFALSYPVSLLYAMIPFFPGMGMSISALPLFIYIFLKIYDNSDKNIHWIVLYLFPFFTSFVLVYAFVIFLAILWYCYCLIIKKQNHKKLVLATILITLLYLLAEYRLLTTMFFDQGFVSHREEFIRRFIGFWDAYKGAHNELLIGQSHSQSYQSPFIILTILLGIISIGLSKWHLTRWFSFAIFTAFVIGLSGGFDFFIYGKLFLPITTAMTLVLWFFSEQKRYAAFMFFIVGSAWWYGFWYYEGWLPVIAYLPLLKIFDFSRFALLQPPVWYLLLALSSFYLIRYNKIFGMVIVLCVIAMQFVLLWDIRPFYPDKGGLNFKSYYASRLFERIDKNIGLPKKSYRVASVGIPPAVALFNGFYTLDGYSPNYPLSYKHRFRKIIAENFVTNENSRQFFDKWGNQCYIIAGDKGYEKYEPNSLMHGFHFNTDVFQELGGRYLFSGYRIENADDLNLILIDKFESPDSFWTIWLYEVKSRQ